jgi:TfoX/Sxy family transcriptional regulator of competence genes
VSGLAESDRALPRLRRLGAFGGDKPMSYWSAPLEALEDPDLLADWVRKALAAAERAKAPKPRKRAI